VNKFL